MRSRLRAQPATLQGFVTDQSNGEALELVNIALLGANSQVKGGVTNRDGLYFIPNVNPGRYVLRASYIGYQTYTDTLDLAAGERRSLNIALLPGEAALDEVVVESERTSGAARITAGQQTIRPRDIELVPTPDLSGDLASFLTTLPGVVTVGDRGDSSLFAAASRPRTSCKSTGCCSISPFTSSASIRLFPRTIRVAPHPSKTSTSR